MENECLFEETNKPKNNGAYKQPKMTNVIPAMDKSCSQAFNRKSNKADIN